jgi:hypothetical protein
MKVNDLFNKAQSLFGKVVTRKTKVYDASKNKLVIAGFNIDAITNLELSYEPVSKSEIGTSQGYYCYYEVWENQVITFDVLPTAQCLDVLKSLISAQVTNGGWVSIELTDNGNLVNKYRGHLISYPNLNQNREAGDRQFSFGVIPTKEKTKTIVNTVTPNQYTGNAQTYPLNEDGEIIRRKLPLPFK